jgi:hypothetical protein
MTNRKFLRLYKSRLSSSSHSFDSPWNPKEQRAKRKMNNEKDSAHSPHNYYLRPRALRALLKPHVARAKDTGEPKTGRARRNTCCDACKAVRRRCVGPRTGETGLCECMRCVKKRNPKPACESCESCKLKRVKCGRNKWGCTGERNSSNPGKTKLSPSTYKNADTVLSKLSNLDFKSTLGGITSTESLTNTSPYPGYAPAWRSTLSERNQTTYRTNALLDTDDTYVFHLP